MRKLYFFLFISSMVVSCQSLNAQCSNGRYYNKIFSESVTTVTYGNAMKFDSTYQDLKMDIYQPNGDNFAHRPLILLAFGGSFTAGVRQSPDLLVLCDEFSKRGYVCASIDYRLGFPGGSDADTNQFSALIRGVQDMKAAVRYFYKDANTANLYHIDTNQIFIGGVSAGAFMALNYAYLKYDTLSKPAPDWAIPTLLALGGPDGNSGNPGYSQKIKGVIDLCGGLADTVWIMPNDPIMVGVHGTGDSLVRCYFDSVAAVNATESRLFGGGDIKNRLDDLGAPAHSFYLFQGAPHAPFVLPSTPWVSPSKEYMDTTIWLIRDFLYQNVTCDSTQFVAGIEEPKSDISVTIYPNPSNDAINVYLHDDNDMEMSLFSTDGKLLNHQLLYANTIATINKGKLSAGVYILQLNDKNTQRLLRTDKVVFY